MALAIVLFERPPLIYGDFADRSARSIRKTGRQTCGAFLGSSLGSSLD
jgi:hypothetical protein